MIEKVAKNGHKYVELASDESNDLGWGNICDICNTGLIGSRYYIAVLNYGVCKKCLKNWESRADYFIEDVWFEKNALNVLRNSGLPYVESKEVSQDA